MTVGPVCHRLKGSSVAATRLMGGKFQESSTEESQGSLRAKQTLLPAGAPSMGHVSRVKVARVWEATGGISAAGPSNSDLQDSISRTLANCSLRLL